MTAYQKIAVSMPLRVAESARRAVRQGRATSVSAYVTSAIEEKAKLDDLGALFDEMLAETGGPMTTAEVRDADRVLGTRTTKTKAKAKARRTRRR